MAKKRKSRRAKKKKRRTQVRERALPVSQERVAPAPSSAPAVKAKAAVPAVDFSHEYRYVISDLKRIGIIAASMLALLVILSFVIK